MWDRTSAAFRKMVWNSKSQVASPSQDESEEERRGRGEMGNELEDKFNHILTSTSEKTEKERGKGKKD